MDEKWLGRICRKWQRRLGLMDWTITVTFVPLAELTEGTVANISWEPDDVTTAQMWVARPDEVAENFAINDTARYIERNIVHEFGHLLFYGHLPIPEYDVNTERAINKMSYAFVPKRKGE